MRFASSIAHLASVLTVLNACISSLATLPSAVIFPLYIYPEDGCSGWTPLISSISTYTTLEFLPIVNPASGPGAAGSQPDTNYQTCIAQLRTTGAASGGNVKILGYVATGYGSRATVDITTDINTYVGWAESYRPEGIFFDESTGDPALVSQYQGYVSRAKTGLGSNAYIALNPGVWDDSWSSPSYFSFVDLIVTFEDTYGNFAVAAFPAGTLTPTSKQAAIIHTGPTQVPIKTVKAITQTLVLGASFYSDFDSGKAYEQFPTDWTNYLDSLVSTQASSL